MPSSREYSNAVVSSNGCSYATLNHYNENYSGRRPVNAPVPSQTRSNQIVIVPSFGGPGYQSLMHSQNSGCGRKTPSCSGYYSVYNAYPSSSNACAQFSSRMC
jgi:hypothetical protein